MHKVEYKKEPDQSRDGLVFHNYNVRIERRYNALIKSNCEVEKRALYGRNGFVYLYRDARLRKIQRETEV